MKLTIENGWAIIEAAGLTIRVPSESDSMADDRAEIICNGQRVYVESRDDGPLVTGPEPVQVSR